MQIQKENHQNAPARRPGPRTIAAPADVYENEQEILVVADFPGVPLEAITVDLDGIQLTLEGQQEGENGAKLRRSFQMPSTVDAGRVAARIEHGVLRVTLPKREDAKPRRIEVKGG